jgi:hypothetical protein
MGLYGWEYDDECRECGMSSQDYLDAVGDDAQDWEELEECPFCHAGGADGDDPDL